MALDPYDPRLGSFDSDIFPEGIDLRRSIINDDPGIWVADPTATFRAGQVVAQNSAGRLQACNGTGSAPLNVPFGFAKWNKALSLYSVVKDEPIILNGTTATNLKYANLQYGAVRVASEPGFGGTTYTVTTDYTVNTTNGQITRNGGGAIPNGGTVYVTYTRQMSESDLEFQGRNFYNFLDDVTVNQGRITVIQQWSVLFLLTYDPSRTYSIGEALYVDGGGTNDGLITNNSGSSRPQIGRVRQLPTADDPYLGISALII